MAFLLLVGTDLVATGMFRFTTRKVIGRHRITVIYGDLRRFPEAGKVPLTVAELDWYREGRRRDCGADARVSGADTNAGL